MKFLSVSLYMIISLVIVTARNGKVFSINEGSVCNVKLSCNECLHLPHCSWCVMKNICFSKELTTDLDLCRNDSINYTDYGFSLKDNAECSCARGKMEGNCLPPGAPGKEECSSRGSCICGRCICDPTPDSENPTKAIMGEYCEFDNFSCDGPHCNEGPYLLSQGKADEQNFTMEDIEQPTEI